MGSSLADLTERLRRFAEDRDWGQFHTPKNLVMALVGEVGELSALVQWVKDDQFDDWISEAGHHDAFRHEIADVMAYLLRLCDVVGIDPLEALDEKITINEDRYPRDRARGNARKYDQL